MPRLASYPDRPLKFDTLDPEVSARYYDTLVAHILAVQEAGEKIGVPVEQLWVHDLSKFSTVEYVGYANHFQGGGAPDLFAPAWLHHIHHNPHHWQYWIFPDGYSPRGSDAENGVLPMPYNYALEMIADWMGAGKVYSGTDDMSDWLSKNIPRIVLHSDTAEYVRETLDMLGYADTVNGLSFAKVTK